METTMTTRPSPEQRPKNGTEARRLELTINDREIEVLAAPHVTLRELLRENLALTGTKHGCELGECGACTVPIDGLPRLSCLTLAVACEGSLITTIEGLSAGPELHPLQEAFAELGAAQCGYCTPGVLLTAKALLEQNSQPSRAEIEQATAGNLCRCTGYLKIYEAIELAAKQSEG